MQTPLDRIDKLIAFISSNLNKSTHQTSMSQSETAKANETQVAVETKESERKQDTVVEKTSNDTNTSSKTPLVGIFGQIVPAEDPNDPFDRQRCIPDWNQSLISSQTALLLGVGGIGCSIALALARIGIKKMILIDYDKVEISNLNRQILYTLNDVGKYKVDCAKNALLTAHNIDPNKDKNKNMHMSIETYNFDALEKWCDIVKLAGESNVIFNAIDVGNGFDIAVISLCMALKLPYVSGSSYCHSWIVEYFTGNNIKHSSFTYDNPDPANMTKEILDKLTPDKILLLKDLKFLPHDDNPSTRLIGSNCLVATIGGMMSVNAWIQGLIQRECKKRELKQEIEKKKKNKEKQNNKEKEKDSDKDKDKVKEKAKDENENNKILDDLNDLDDSKIDDLLADNVNELMPNFTKMDICHYWDKDDIIAWPMPIVPDSNKQS